MQGLLRIGVYVCFFILYFASSDIAGENNLYLSKILGGMCIGVLIFFVTNIEFRARGSKRKGLGWITCWLFFCFVFLLLSMAIEARFNGVKFSLGSQCCERLG